MARKKKAPEAEQQILDKMRIREKLQEAFQRGVESLRTITHILRLKASAPLSQTISCGFRISDF
ncbi:hypothetical protein [Sinorhizobium meliloti]|uniref:hypothetical protein n=1 Tax=Rhizobium meliloti TaxID=382 RepID=UPI000FDC3C46|nr:hypothetical protein [Sinorhizobium meliloti]RVG79136.1 hypothetical protein CN219_27005 [Sinorhizobium meliloti]RVI35209.1 hypothetical protein CN197_14360 [Sinorhizobium meliloti]RVI39964.1 hypothetical protein CN196_30040 [Sinorhizobium meliloti]RVJ20080.1 hypothetical protein CN177_24365 [Sinorhizobium meliloti]RVK03703.1 hypothetical protein CN170_03380 [Sinorhizobium meliloti]